MAKGVHQSLLLIALLIPLAYCFDPNYDFVIVGGGTAGCTVARRLAEAGHKVLIMESGGVPKPGMEIPVFAPNFLGVDDVLFQYKSLPQSNLGDDGIVGVITGRVLGGTSSINYMFVNRGHPRDYDDWVTSTGDDSWSYANMLKYFKRMETYSGDFPSDQHGSDGPITISRSKYAPGLTYWFGAGKQFGFPIADPNGPQKISFTPVEFSKKFGRRVSSYVGYIQPIAHLPNIHLFQNYNATEIVFSGKKAVGVKFETDVDIGSQPKIVYASKEIIVSAGTYGSTQLLLRSGIGPREVLRNSQNYQFLELPVGQNFHDHLVTIVHFAINNKQVVVVPARDLNQVNFRFYNQTGDGPYSLTQGISGQAFLASSVAKAEGQSDWPDIQYYMSHSVEIFEGNFPNVTLPYGKVPMSIGVFLGRPKSRGTVTLYPDDSPMIDFQFLQDPKDMEAYVSGMKQLVAIMEQSQTYKQLGAQYIPIDLPACQQFQVKSDEYWKCYIQQNAGSGCHPVGTCKMGKATDPTAVVDTQLRVIGIENLRVVDASVMPRITNANTQTPVYGIAEKASDMILQQWSGHGKVY